jgi:hypothetical protein
MAGPVTIQDVQGLIDPQKGYQFQMLINPVRGSFSVSSQILSLRCTSTELPGIALDQVVVDLAGFTLEYAGRIRFQHTWTTTLVEGQDSGVRTTIASWMKLAYNWLTGKGSFKADIQATAKIQMFNDPGDPSVANYLYGIFPISNPAIALAMGDSRALTPAITWSFDYTDIDEIANQGLQA